MAISTVKGGWKSFLSHNVPKDAAPVEKFLLGWGFCSGALFALALVKAVPATEDVPRTLQRYWSDVNKPQNDIFAAAGKEVKGS